MFAVVCCGSRSAAVYPKVYKCGPGQDHGGDCSDVPSKLRDVQLVKGSLRAFAALMGDGSVGTWGDPVHGGDSSNLAEREVES